MLTETINKILEKEQEAEQKLSDARMQADADFKTAEKNAVHERDVIISDAKKAANDEIQKALSEAEHMYAEAEEKASALKKSIAESSADFVKKVSESAESFLFRNVS